MHWYLIIDENAVRLNDFLSKPFDIELVILDDLDRWELRNSKSHHEVDLLIVVPHIALIECISLDERVHRWVMLRQQMLQFQHSKYHQNVYDRE